MAVSANFCDTFTENQKSGRPSRYYDIISQDESKFRKLRLLSSNQTKRNIAQIAKSVCQRSNQIHSNFMRSIDESPLQ